MAEIRFLRKPMISIPKQNRNEPSNWTVNRIYDNRRLIISAFYWEYDLYMDWWYNDSIIQNNILYNDLPVGTKVLALNKDAQVWQRNIW